MMILVPATVCHPPTQAHSVCYDVPHGSFYICDSS
jgi:hypothetical protein